MLRALLEPTDIIRKYELEGKTAQVLTYLEEAKAMPWGAVYDEFCERNNVPVGESYLKEVEAYEKEVTSKR
jgi:L-rhamnose isomerase